MVNGAMLLVNGGCFVYSGDAFGAEGSSLVQPAMSVLFCFECQLDRFLPVRVKSDALQGVFGFPRGDRLRY
jgi:hypothetical protein